MDNSVSLLKQRVRSKQILGVVVPSYTFQTSILPLFCVAACQNRVRHLNVRIVRLVVTQYKITFQLADFAYAYRIIHTDGVGINYIFQSGTKIDSIIRV